MIVITEPFDETERDRSRTAYVVREMETRFGATTGIRRRSWGYLTRAAADSKKGDLEKDEREAQERGERPFFQNVYYIAELPRETVVMGYGSRDTAQVARNWARRTMAAYEREKMRGGTNDDDDGDGRDDVDLLDGTPEIVPENAP